MSDFPANDTAPLRIKKVNSTSMSLLLSKEELYQMIDSKLRAVCKIPDHYQSQVRMRYSMGVLSHIEFEASKKDDVVEDTVHLKEIEMISAEAFAHHYLDLP